MSDFPCVLIVEDDRSNREALARLIRHLGFEVTTATGVAEAIGKLIRRPHCLILDLDLPDGCGTEVAHAARQENPDCAVAMVSGTIPPERVLFQPDAFFVKPVSPVQVMQWVQDHLRDRPFGGDGTNG